MATNELDYQARVAKRARWEDMSFTLGAPGIVKVVNESYGAEERHRHAYLVNVTDGEATGCTCPAFDKYLGDCKHMAAVEANDPVIDAASASADEVRAARGMD